MNQNNLVLFAMSNTQKLSRSISNYLSQPLGEINRVMFADGEVILQSKHTVRNRDVFVIASTSTPVNENIMELLLFIDSLKRASAKSINIVLTYYGYARQDRKTAGRQPIGAKLVADLLECAGATRVISIDLHNESIQGFFNIPVDSLKGLLVLAPQIKKLGQATIVSPDHGGVARARLLAEWTSDNPEVAIVDKRRVGPNQAQTMGVLGNVQDKNIIIIDDMIDTCGTIVKAAKALKEAGAKKIIVAATHGIFSKGFDVLGQNDLISKVIVTDSIERVNNFKSNKLEIVSLAPFLAKVIKATENSTSISRVYQEFINKLKELD